MEVKNERGMTLVEIMIAVGLLGGLALAGMSLFKNQNEAQKTVEANYEVTTIVSQMRAVLASIVNCSATLGGVAVNGGTVTRLKKDVNSVLQDVFIVNTQLPGNIKVNSYTLDNTFPGLASNETMLKVSFSRGKTAIKDEITKSLKVVFTASAGNIVSCYAFNNNSDSYWVLASNGNDIHYPGGNVGIGVSNPDFPLTIATPATSGSHIRLTNGTYSGYVTGSSGQNGTQISGGVYQDSIGWKAITSSGALLTVGTSGFSLARFSGATVGSDVSTALNSNTIIYGSSTTGQVGIGTSSPMDRLHSIGNILMANGGVDSPNLRLWDSTQGVGGKTWNIDSSGGSFRIFDEPISSISPLASSAGTERVMIAPTTGHIRLQPTNGNVGIGNIGTPSSLLHLSSGNTGFAGGLRLDNTSASGRSYSISSRTDGGFGGRLSIADESSNAERIVVSAAGNVGIGTSSPGALLHLIGGSIYLGSNSGGASSEGLGPQLHLSGTSGTNTDAMYFQRNNIGADVSELRLYLGDNAGALQDTLAIGATDGGAWYPRLTVNGGGRVGINNSSPSYELDVRSTTGTGGSVQAGAFFYYSDARMKDNISTIENPLQKIRALRGVNFTWKDNKKEDIGLIAQEVLEVEPRLVSEDSEGYLSVKYGNIIAIVIEAIKELFSTDEELKRENKILNQKLENLEKRIQQLELKLAPQRIEAEV